MKGKLKHLYIFCFLLAYSISLFSFSSPTITYKISDSTKNAQNSVNGITCEEIFTHTLPSATSVTTYQQFFATNQFSDIYFYSITECRFAKHKPTILFENYFFRNRNLIIAFSPPDIVYPFHYFI